MKTVDIVVSEYVGGNIKDVFEYVVPIELSEIFKKNGLIPGVIATSNKDKWYVPGMTRTVYFDDKSTAKEQLTSLREFESFTYTIRNFSSVFKYLIEEINGKWIFRENDEKSTEVIWEYSLVPHNVLTMVIITMLAKQNIRSVLFTALEIMKEGIENPQEKTVRVSRFP